MLAEERFARIVEKGQRIWHGDGGAACLRLGDF